MVYFSINLQIQWWLICVKILLLCAKYHSCVESLVTPTLNPEFNPLLAHIQCLQYIIWHWRNPLALQMILQSCYIMMSVSNFCFLYFLTWRSGDHSKSAHFPLNVFITGYFCSTQSAPLAGTSGFKMLRRCKHRLQKNKQALWGTYHHKSSEIQS